MKYNIAVIAGDGIGPEIMEQGIMVLDKIGSRFGHEFSYTHALAGGCAIDATGIPLPEETLKICRESDSVLLGAVGGPKWDNPSAKVRPEQALLGLRGALGLFANLRPASLFPQLKDACLLKPETVANGLDILIVRELTGGIYFGKSGITEDGKGAYDTEYYTVEEIERVARVGFEAAQKRDKRLCLVDKANVLESSRLWRKVVTPLASEYPDVELSYMYVDNAAMQLVKNPTQFDVIVTSNIFGDILSDLASMLTGSIGMLPSASLGNTKLGMYEPIHGSAPDIMGQNKANPIAMILSIGMMLKYSFGLNAEAQVIEDAVKAALDKGYRTGDIGGGANATGCKEMGKIIAELI